MTERLLSLEGRCLDSLDEGLRLVGERDFTIDAVPRTEPLDAGVAEPGVAATIADFNRRLVEAQALLHHYRTARTYLLPAPAAMGRHGAGPLATPPALLAQARRDLRAYNERRAEMATLVSGLAAPTATPGATATPATPAATAAITVTWPAASSPPATPKRGLRGHGLSARDVQRCIDRLCDVLLGGGGGHRVVPRRLWTTGARAARRHRKPVDTG